MTCFDSCTEVPSWIIWTCQILEAKLRMHKETLSVRASPIVTECLKKRGKARMEDKGEGSREYMKNASRDKRL